eukprot:g77847.t1
MIFDNNMRRNVTILGTNSMRLMEDTLKLSRSKRYTLKSLKDNLKCNFPPINQKKMECIEHSLALKEMMIERPHQARGGKPEQPAAAQPS